MHWDSQQKILLAHFQEEGVGARNHFIAIPWVDDYAYWDTGDDLPRGVSRRAFEQRGEIWEKLNKNPKKLTFTVGWQPDWTPDNSKDLFPHLKGASSRALTLATQECERVYVEENFKPVSPGSTFGVASVMFKFRDLLDDVQSNVRKQRDELAERLKAVLADGQALQKAIDLPINSLAETGVPPAPNRLRP